MYTVGCVQKTGGRTFNGCLILGWSAKLIILYPMIYHRKVWNGLISIVALWHTVLAYGHANTQVGIVSRHRAVNQIIRSMAISNKDHPICQCSTYVRHKCRVYVICFSRFVKLYIVLSPVTHTVLVL